LEIGHIERPSTPEVARTPAELKSTPPRFATSPLASPNHRHRLPSENVSRFGRR
jgi:hypothetical protein